jgi:hypothetical protein
MYDLAVEMFVASDIVRTVRKGRLPLPAKRGPAPLSDAVIYAVGYLVDDHQAEVKRRPSHSDLNQQITRAGVHDPTKDGPPLGKRKRVQAVLSLAMEQDVAGGEKLVRLILESVRAAGGFRKDSPNYAGDDAIASAADVFRSEGFHLQPDGELLQNLLDNLSGSHMTEALQAYVRRAKRGALDAALVTSTGKDLVEATAAHVLVERMGAYPRTQDFRTLLGQAYSNLGMSFEATPQAAALDRLDAALYQAACAVNTLRNKEGVGHGRPFLSGVTLPQAHTAIEVMGIVAERLLAVLKEKR